MKISFKNKFTVYLFNFGVEMLTGYSFPLVGNNTLSHTGTKSPLVFLESEIC